MIDFSLNGERDSRKLAEAMDEATNGILKAILTCTHERNRVEEHRHHNDEDTASNAEDRRAALTSAISSLRMAYDDCNRLFLDAGVDLSALEDAA